eukprot:403337763
MNVTNMHNLNILIVTLLFLQQVFGNTECFVSSMNVIGCGENQQNCVGYQTTEMGVTFPLTLNYGYIGIGASKSQNVLDMTDITVDQDGIFIIRYDDYMNVEWGKQIKNWVEYGALNLVNMN